MPEFKLERFKYTWKGDWATGTAYRRDDIVLVGGKSYVCMSGHTASAAFTSDLNYTLPGSVPPLPQPRWRIMTDGRKFVGEWITGQVYNEGDIVLKDGNLYVCNNEHTSANFVDNASDWDLYISHIAFQQNWQTSTDYAEGALVKYNGIVYKCIQPHVSGVFLEDNLVTTPSILSVTVGRNTEDTANVYYIQGAEQLEVTLGRGKTYRFDQSDDTNNYFGGAVVDGVVQDNPHPLLLSETADGTFGGGSAYTTGVTYWLDGSEVDQAGYLSGFSTATTRYLEITVSDTAPDALYYYCRYHSGMGASIIVQDTADVAWEIFHNGIEYAGAWTTETLYRKNDVVKYGGSIWRCTETHQSDDTALDTTKFIIELPGFQYESTYDSTVQYQPGDVVRYGGYLYYANNYNLDDQPAQETDSTRNWIELQYSYNFRGPWDLNTDYNPGDVVERGGDLYMALVTIGGANQDGSTKDYLENTAFWELLTSSKAWAMPWVSNKLYHVNEVVYYFGESYVCNEAHTSADNNFPGDNGSGFYYWDLLVTVGQPGGLNNSGDLLTFNLTRNEIGDTSSIGVTNVPVGDHEQVLSINAEHDLFYRDLIDNAQTIYVGVAGEDKPGFGRSLNKPFKTINYACQFVDDTFSPLTPVKVKVDGGKFTEIGPITVPAGTVVMGDELRSTSIVQTSAIAEYENDFQFTTETIFDRFQILLLSIFENTPIVVTPGNTETQIIAGGSVGLAELNLVTILLDDFESYVDFSTRSGGVNPTVVGTNTLTSDASRRKASKKLLENSEFLVQEILAWARVSYPASTHTDERLGGDLRQLIRAIGYDLKYEGNYKTILAARRYSNAVNGAGLDDLFWLRDTTGLRNCTVDGMIGTLNPPGVFDLYQRPTGGAYCALDPGWGPDDNRTWINNRSPYIQGVTTLGRNGVGQKIDGSLHNGGNKSFVSNDFTQVISDGVGAWVLNGARAELVSVFTYYAQVGYLAENGGIIRSANGNNSYGSFGSIADGLDPNEVPTIVNVWNRDNDPNVDRVFAGLFSDEIFALEYEHCGEQFTNATATITGSGVDADVEFNDFRDGALFQSRLTAYQDSGTPGGVGYFVAQNNAAAGDATTITLAQSEEATEEQILGCRIWIIAGDGTGQYGYINSYNQGTRVAQVYKDSDGTPGWEHIVPGTDIATVLSQNARYRIEPRISVSHPGFSDTLHDPASARPFVDAAFSDTSATFTDVSLDTGSGNVVDDDGLIATGATVTITKTGTVYSATITDGGAGYAVGDTTVVPGTSLGGLSPDHDCTVRVSSTTEDSTNAADELTVTGTARGGLFAAIATPNFVNYSYDGINWLEANLPNPGILDFKRIVSGNNRFFILSKDTDEGIYSLDGINWNTVTLPSSDLWSDCVYADGKFVAIAENSNNVIYSTDAINWNTAVIPDDGVGDSTASQYEVMAYGHGKFVALSGNDQVILSSTNGTSWTTSTDTDLPATADFKTWLAMAYGNNRFVALTTEGEIYYSLDGADWESNGTLPTQDGSTVMNWIDLKYSQGVFMAICDTGGQVVGADPRGFNTNFCVTSEDGITWTSRTLSGYAKWSAVTSGTVNGTHYWLAIADTQQINGISRISTGCRAKVRANIGGGATFDSVNILDPGSGYSGSNLPVFTITDNEHTVEVTFENRIGNGVLAQPDWVNRGNGYRTNTTTVTITGDGFADVVPETNIIKFYNVPDVNAFGPGSQILFDNVFDDTTENPDDYKSFRAAVITDLGDDGTGNGTRLVQVQISPRIRNEYDMYHDTRVTLNFNYSQCRISGHDFLDIGTGNFQETNYPELYAGGAYFIAAPENEVLEQNGGRVYYVSTDQDGNFRAGELFSVQQATGIVTISAEFFDLDGLSELALGGVRLGGSGAVVREFSTDATFAEDSNNVVPTQKAIATFLADRLSVGGSDLTLNSFVAGIVKVGTDQNLIASNVPGDNIFVPVKVNISGSDPTTGEPIGLRGSILAQDMFLRNDVETMK